MKRDSTLLVVAAMLAGCSLAPPLATPPSGLPASFPVESTATPSVGPSATVPVESTAIADSVTAYQLGWEEFFRDAQLRQLIGIALENNQDLAAATARIAQAEAQYRIQNSFRTPSLNANMGLQRSGGPAPNGIGRGTIDNALTQVSVPAFELDFWAGLPISASRPVANTLRPWRPNKRSDFRWWEPWRLPISSCGPARMASCWHSAPWTVAVRRWGWPS